MLEGYPKMTTSAQLQYDFDSATQQANSRNKFKKGAFCLVGGGFTAVQAPFWENAMVKCRFVAGFGNFIFLFGGCIFLVLKMYQFNVSIFF